MCGLFGLAEPNGISVDLSLLRACRDTLAHRGPDSAGEYQDEVVYLGFRRLAIVDLAPEANQPMTSEDGQTWIVFNGEIYNFVELRRELLREGHIFRTVSDTEVLLHLYSKYGTEMFTYLNGMFAIAVYDRHLRQIILARDRMGKKPLYYWHHNHSLAFASELRALEGLKEFPAEHNPQAVAWYLRLGWVPSWSCIFPGVAKLPPASWMSFNLTTQRVQGPTMYWDLPQPEFENNVPEAIWLDRIESLLDDATRIRLRSDVPLGAFLSGGVDSSLVTASAARQQKGSFASLTVGFPEWAENEWPLAEATARQLGIVAIHHDLDAQGVQLLPATMAHFDEPFSDASALPTSLICKTARATMTVALSGDGGDELFGGYDNHLRARHWRALDNVSSRWRRPFAAIGIKLSAPDSRSRRFWRRCCYPVGTLGLGAKLYPFEDWISVFASPEFRLADDAIEAKLNTAPISGSTPVDLAQRTDIRLYMLDDILVKVDRMSMLHSLEVRSPFLDYRLVELALRIPPSLRVRMGRSKYLLRQLALRQGLHKVAHAPKRGFGIPLRDWLFASKATPELHRLMVSHSSIMPILVPGGGRRLWQMAKTNDALVSALLRVLSFYWWSDRGN